MNTQSITKIFKNTIESYFGNSLEFAFFSGRMAFGILEKGKSDIDIVIVMNDNGLRNFKNLRRKFVDFYFNVHKKYGLVPDSLWPGEFLTILQLEEALKGRGFDIVKGRLDLLNAVNDSDWCYDRMYRIWLVMIYLSKFLAGDKELYETFRSNASMLILKFLIYKFNLNSVTPESISKLIIGGGKGFLGIRTVYERVFHKVMIKTIENSIGGLLKEGFLFKMRNKVMVNKPKIEIWSIEVLRLLKSDKWRTKLLEGTYYSDLSERKK